MDRAQWAAITAVVLALLFAAAAAVATAGDGGRDTGPHAPATDSADAGFARDMSDHHQQAVEMSFVVRERTTDEEVRRLAYDIANTQANQRGMMQGWLEMWGLPKVSMDQKPMEWMGMPVDDPEGRMPGMASRAEMERLRGASGRQAEVLYLQLMTEHHKGGVHMAEGCVRQCEPGVERDLAQGMVTAQQSEIGLMADLLKARGAAPRR
ncbi:DUF305 domain-containing protein [Streptomyces sp. NPDC001941]|uniref:DUF305 domain-containing protein n=1 Tax=Streptomyces sp. NPDC001941 TaxID=3154659 RepID=UPI00331D1632